MVTPGYLTTGSQWWNLTSSLKSNTTNFGQLIFWEVTKIACLWLFLWKYLWLLIDFPDKQGRELTYSLWVQLNCSSCTLHPQSILLRMRNHSNLWKSILVDARGIQQWSTHNQHSYGSNQNHLPHTQAFNQFIPFTDHFTNQIITYLRNHPLHPFPLVPGKFLY